MRRGLVIGKFYPFHRGHGHLIASALRRCDALTVAVCHHPNQDIPGEVRAGWIREVYPEAKVIIVEDCVPADDSQGWAGYTRRFLGHAPDVVFTSESYGEAYARHLGCAHELIDLSRNAVPVSGTAVRENPLRQWQYLDPCVRAWFACRTVVIGAESTGKTTLCKQLAEYFRTVWVPEFGRMYYESKVHSAAEGTWESREFELIAAEQNRLEDRGARECNKLLICDTDSFATAIWHERYLKCGSPSVEALASGRRPAHYFLCAPDVPFVQDGFRDGEHMRAWMHETFLERLTHTGRRFTLLSGSYGARWDCALEVCKTFLC
ncbi:MAG: AAA family ATPase [Verrucomicrobiae bacterium]|nr:AAA family ATPase [Verrucomicrobiae bacterium]